MLAPSSLGVSLLVELMGFPDLPPFLMIALPHTPSEFPESMPEKEPPLQKSLSEKGFKKEDYSILPQSLKEGSDLSPTGLSFL